MDPKEMFAKAVAQGSSCFAHVTADQFDNETPCTDWKLKQLLNHMVYELLWVPDLLQGKTVEDVGSRFDGDVLHSDFQTSWGRAADAALMAVKHVDPNQTVHLSYGDFPAKYYVAEVAGDVLLHTWDVAQSIKCNLMLDEAVVKAVYDNLLPRKTELADSGLFGEPIEVPDSADMQTKLLGLVGRQASRVA